MDWPFWQAIAEAAPSAVVVAPHMAQEDAIMGSTAKTSEKTRDRRRRAPILPQLLP
jgi:hypothetical protein